MSLLFTILLAEFRQSGILERVKPGHGGKIPKQCSDPGAFHGTYATAFVKYYEGNFEDLEAAEQRQVLETFLRVKFSIDKMGQCMVPEDVKRWKVLSWTGFYITEDELLEIVEKVMTAYETHRDAARSRATAASSSRNTGWYHRLS